MDIIATFREIVNAHEPPLSVPVATIKALAETLKKSQASTVSGFIEDLNHLKTELIQYTNSAVSILSGCEMFGRYVTRVASDELNFEQFKVKLFERAEAFSQSADICKAKIAKHGVQFITDGANILIHSMSKVVMELLELAAKQNKRFHVYATEARPSCSGVKAYQHLTSLGIPCHVVLDTAVGYFMKKIDMVLVGAEGVVENGGIINQVGTYQISILAKALNKPFYALAETYKFVRLFPLDQYDLPSSTSSSFELVQSSRSSFSSKNLTSQPNNGDCSDAFLSLSVNPMVDYTPPSYITLLFTDLGILTPSGVSDELIKFYY